MASPIASSMAMRNVIVTGGSRGLGLGICPLSANRLVVGEKRADLVRQGVAADQHRLAGQRAMQGVLRERVGG